MPLISFSLMLDKLRDGTKTQTIRKPRKQPLKVGDKLFVYWKLRTNQCHQLGEAKVTKIVNKHIGYITQQDAVLDGFSSLQELVFALNEMHPKISKLDIITFEWTKKSPFFYG